MIRRCQNPADPAFVRYGLRGISVCQSWRRSFVAFIRDVGHKPSPNHTLDRIDNDKGYEPGNVRWATRTEQARNRSSNKFLTLAGETHCLSEWAEILGKRPATFWFRVRSGWTEEELLNCDRDRDWLLALPRNAANTSGPLVLSTSRTKFIVNYFFVNGPSTVCEIAKALGVVRKDAASTVSTIFARLDILERTGETRPTITGHRAAVIQLKEGIRPPDPLYFTRKSVGSRIELEYVDHESGLNKQKSTPKAPSTDAIGTDSSIGHCHTSPSQIADVSSIARALVDMERVIE